MDDAREFTLRDYLALFARRRWVVLSAVVVLAGLATVYSLVRPPLYRSTTGVQVNQQTTADVFDAAGQGTGSSIRSLANEAVFVTSFKVSSLVEQQHGEGDAAVTVASSAVADVLEISVVSSDPVRARDVAAAYATTYIDQRRQSKIDDITETNETIQAGLAEIDALLATPGLSNADIAALETRKLALSDVGSNLALIAQLGGGVGADIIRPAEIENTPVSPRTRRNIIIGLLGGTMLGLGLALAVENLDRSIKSPAQLEAVTGGVPNLAVVPTLRDWRNRSTTRLISIEDPNSPTAEAYRTLRAALQFVAVDQSLSVIQLTSANPGEGKTTTSVNLAVALAKAGRRVVLVDADLRKPRIHAFFNLPAEPGLTSIIVGQSDIATACQVVEDNPGVLAVLPSGPLPPGPSELLGSQRSADMFETLRGVADIVIVDSPPVLPVADSLVLSAHVDATLLVANAARARTDDVRRAVELLEQVEANLVGTILNQISSSGGAGYGYGYGYGQNVPARGRFGRRTVADPDRQVRPLEPQSVRSRNQPTQSGRPEEMWSDLGSSPTPRPQGFDDLGHTGTSWG